MTRIVVIAGALALIVTGCGSSTNAQAAVISSPGTIGTGEQRVLVNVIDVETGEGLAAEDIPVTATLRDRIGSPLGEYQGEFVWMIPDVRGIYAFHVEIPGPGTFQMTIDAGELGDLGPVGVVAMDDPAMVSVGDQAPRSETRTTDSHEITEITTDPDPEPSFYEMTVAEAVDQGPSVIVFATPAWCTTQSCGPMLDLVQGLAPDFSGLNYVHVEVYENINASSFDDLVLVPAVSEWQLPTEPWVFVVDHRGTVTAAFEGAASENELAAAFAAASRDG